MAWFSFSTIYMLGFPTLMSATAGYLTPSTAGFNMTDGTFLTADSPQLQSCYNLTAGALVGYQNGTVIPGPPVSQFDVVDSSIAWDSPNATNQLLSEVPGIKAQFPVFVDLFNGEDSSNTRNTLPLTVHALVYNMGNARIYDATNTSFPPRGPDGYDSYLATFTTNATINNHTYIFHNYDFTPDAYQGWYCYNNKTIEDLPALAKCLPESFFVWGFSSLLVYIVISLQIVWFFGMYIVWLDANINSSLCRHGRNVRGHFRAATDLAEAAREVLGTETCAYTDEEMSRELGMQRGIRYYAEDTGSGDVAHVGLSSRRLGPVEIENGKLYGRQDKLD